MATIEDYRCYLADGEIKQQANEFIDRKVAVRKARNEFAKALSPGALSYGTDDEFIGVAIPVGLKPSTPGWKIHTKYGKAIESNDMVVWAPNLRGKEGKALAKHLADDKFTIPSMEEFSRSIGIDPTIIPDRRGLCVVHAHVGRYPGDKVMIIVPKAIDPPPVLVDCTPIKYSEYYAIVEGAGE